MCACNHLHLAQSNMLHLLTDTSPSTENLSFQHLELLKSLHNQHSEFIAPFWWGFGVQVGRGV